jgi:hypothetical protein
VERNGENGKSFYGRCKGYDIFGCFYGAYILDDLLFCYRHVGVLFRVKSIRLYVAKCIKTGEGIAFVWKDQASNTILEETTLEVNFVYLVIL